MPPRAGLTATVRHVVTAADLASSVGSGDVEVLSTPTVLAVCERATMAALSGHLADTDTSVGVRVQLDHLQPTAAGDALEATATLERVEGRRLMFLVEVTDHRGRVASGLVSRMVLDRRRFLERLA